MTDDSPAISADQLLALAGERNYTRGLDYARGGAVEIGTRKSQGVSATVTGTRPYHVTLRWKRKRLDGDCDCPVGATGEFCKHQIALAVVWAGLVVPPEDDGTGSSPAMSAGLRSMRDDESTLRRWLDAMDAGALRALALDLAARDDGIRREFLARARVATGDPSSHRLAIGNLIGRPRFLDHRASNAYAKRLETLLSLLASVLAKDAVSALDLCDHALQRLFRIYAQSDDSGGAIGEVLARIGCLHLDAALAARPEPKAFARAWLKLKLADDWGIVADVTACAPVLGDTGLAHVETQVQSRVDALPARVPGQSRWSDPNPERRPLRNLLHALLRQRGAIDALIADMAKDIEGAYDYLRIAELCHEHRRDREAIAWLERGHKGYPDDRRLLDALADARLREGFPEEALELRWRAFRQRFDDDAYLALRSVARTLGTWDEWRARALAELEARTRAFGADASVDRLVGLHLAEDDIAAAWTRAQSGTLLPHT